MSLQGIFDPMVRAYFKNYYEGGDGCTCVSVEEREVNFYDYDGTCLYAYTIAEAQALTEMPPLPTRPGLICQGWNWSLDMIQKHPIPLDIGATYITDDGATRFVFNVITPGLSTFTVYFKQSKDGGVKINWGDGSAEDTVAGTGLVSVTHQFPLGTYTASFLPDDDCILSFGLGTSGSGPNFINETANNASQYSSLNSAVVKIHIGKNVSTMSAASFSHLNGLCAVTIPQNVTQIGWNSLSECRALSFVVFPDSLTYIYPSAFEDDIGLSKVVFPGTEVGRGNADLFANCTSLRRVLFVGKNGIYERIGRNLYSLGSVVFWDNVTEITNGGIHAIEGLKDIYVLSETPPTLTAVSFNYLKEGATIYIRKGTLAAYSEATNWTILVDYMEELEW